MIKAENIFKSYNGRDMILKDVSLEVEKGEFAVILGASGSGKTTLLNVLSGLEKADGGSVFCCGQNLTQMTDKQLTRFRREKVGFVFQQYYLLPHLSVKANVRLGADLIKNKNYPDIIREVGLEDKINEKPSRLSGGEQQRVCIARALAKRPEILFLDEPTGALDEATGRSVLDYILKLKRENGFTAVMVTHNPNIAETAEKVVYMNSGKIIKITKNARVKSAAEISW